MHCYKKTQQVHRTRREASPARTQGHRQHGRHITTYMVTAGRTQQPDGRTEPQGTTQDGDGTTDSTDTEVHVLGLNLQARKLVEQSLTETEESGKALSRVSTLPRTRPDMHEQSRSERPQSKQHARLILR